MKLPQHKTKIICTLGPACSEPLILKNLIETGMNVARLNFSHGNFNEHAKTILQVKKTAEALKKMVTILIDLPGTKMRVGNIPGGVIHLDKGETVNLTTGTAASHLKTIPIDFKALTASVKKGSAIFLNDGFIQLRVLHVNGVSVKCQVIVGGELRSHKGLNLPGAKLGISAVTQKDLSFVEFGLKHGVDTFGVSFVKNGADLQKVRNFAHHLGKKVYLIAKIERPEAIVNFEDILKHADAVMIARGDLGVEIPTQQVPIIQKKLIHQANMVSRPVIIATQMLESMTENIRPTRAEVTDVANAILDGADAIMLSEETAMGHYPVETVAMMATIAITTEKERESGGLSNDEGEQIKKAVSQAQWEGITDVLSLNAARTADELKAKFFLTPSSSGNTARRLARFKPRSWIIAYTAKADAFRFLGFSYGVYPVLVPLAKKHLHVMLAKMKKSALVKTNDILVLTDRRISTHQGQTDSLAVITV